MFDIAIELEQMMDRTAHAITHLDMARFASGGEWLAKTKSLERALLSVEVRLIGANSPAELRLAAHLLDEAVAAWRRVVEDPRLVKTAFDLSEATKAEFGPPRRT